MSRSVEFRTLTRWITALLVLALVARGLWRCRPFSRRSVPPSAIHTLAMPPSIHIANIDLDALQAEILRPSGIDETALVAAEHRGPQFAAAANFLAARYEHEHNHPEPALTYLQRALQADPANAGLHAWNASLLADAGRLAEAVSESAQAVSRSADDVNILRVRGEVCYRAGQLDEAIAAFEDAQKLAPNNTVQQLLDKIRREARVERHFTEQSRGHFVLRYEDGQPSNALLEDIWRALEQDYDQLEAELGFAPHAAITVVLYNRQQFSTVTAAPEWASAINDGRLRIPLGELTEVTPALQRELRHELTHSFLFDAAPRCPAWLQEGLAQTFEPRTLDAASPAALHAAFASGYVPLRQLEGSFQTMSAHDAVRAYLESLAAVEALRESGGMEQLRWLLRQLGEGQSSDAALAQILSGGYDELDRHTEALLQRHLP